MQQCIEKGKQKHMSNKNRKISQNPAGPAAKSSLTLSFLATLTAFTPTEALDCSSPASVICVNYVYVICGFFHKLCIQHIYIYIMLSLVALFDCRMFCKTFHILFSDYFRNSVRKPSKPSPRRVTPHRSRRVLLVNPSMLASTNMLSYIYIYIYMYIYLCTYIYIHVYIYTYM